MTVDEQPHVVRRDPIDPLRGRGDAADDVAAADDDRDLDAHPVHVADLVGHARDDVGSDAELLLPHQGFARELQEDALVGGALAHASQGSAARRPQLGSPSAGRAADGRGSLPA